MALNAGINNNLFYNLPENIQNKIMEMKKEIEDNEKSYKFSKYLQKREEHNNKMNEMNLKYKNVVFPFGKYKGTTIYNIAIYKDCRRTPIGQNYLKWVSKNVDIKDKLLKECIEFYKNYYYHHTDGYD